MSDAPPDTFNDPLLMPFLQSADDEAGRLLEATIFREAMPIIRRVVSTARSESRYVRTRLEASDVEHDIVVRLVRHLQNLRGNPLHKPISNFHHYVARTSKNVCNTILRRSNPNWISLKNKLWYLFSSDPSLAMWHGKKESHGERDFILCGYKEWRNRERNAGVVDPQKLSQFIVHALVSSRHPITDLQSLPLEELLPHIFAYTRAPLPLNDMVNLVAELWGVAREEFTEFDPDALSSSAESALDPQREFAAAYEDRQLLRGLWDEVQRLPLAQRQALLLTMRMAQGRSALTLLTLTNIATPEQIAAVLEMSIDELEKLNGDLPFKDAEFAQRLGVTRQQVINLRKAARERLKRRAEAGEKHHRSRREGNHLTQSVSK